MKHLAPTLAILIACLPCGLVAQVAVNENFEGSAAGGGTPPPGWTLLGTSGGTPFYTTTSAGAGSNGSGGNSGLAGQVNSTTTPANTEFPGAYLLHGQAFSLPHALNGTFDFLLVNEATTNDDIGFIIGAVGDGIAGTSKGELLYVRLTEGNNSVGGILQDGDGGATDRVQSQPTTFYNDIWYRATVSWTPTSGTTGNFIFVVNQLGDSNPMVTLAVGGFTFDSAAAQIGFGSINDTIRFDNVNFTGTAHGAAPDLELAIKDISVDLDSNIDLLLAGPPGSPYFVYRSSDLERPLYRKRWSERFAGNFPPGVSEVPLSEQKGTETRGFFVATQTVPTARIMCVGDSITEGGSTFSIYRPTLNSQLIAAGYRFQFVGSRTNTQGGFTLNHEGYGGKNCTEIAGFFATNFPIYPADIVIIHAAHNLNIAEAVLDAAGEASIVTTVENATRSMIQTARNTHPGVKILLAKVITSGKLPKYSYILAVNTRLGEIAAELDTVAQPVIIVDQAAGFDWTTDTITDMVHPNAGGGGKMAQKFFDALAPLLE